MEIHRESYVTNFPMRMYSKGCVDLVDIDKFLVHELDTIMEELIPIYYHFLVREGNLVGNGADDVTWFVGDTNKDTEDGMDTCPVCRKVFHAKDIEHNLGNAEDTENNTSSLGFRKHKVAEFEAIIKRQ
ncbi:hypothetical protein M8C21_006505 [Ambrosia artemisiifolia]|uniref:Uncharacterized protein n=1 Tax=Ambrosia artemisiifolia TaxID=4212 RepID=A0AAD5GIA4_AMBAR|nr:hypothetical protein M8C21_006505 [Ambrosia artemisiifolia]